MPAVERKRNYLERLSHGSIVVPLELAPS